MRSDEPLETWKAVTEAQPTQLTVAWLVAQQKTSGQNNMDDWGIGLGDEGLSQGDSPMPAPAFESL